MIKGIIFDFNGTLFQDGEYHVQAWQKISEEITGKAMSREEVEHLSHGVCNEITINRLSNDTLNKEENLAWSRKKEALYRELVQQDKDHAHLVLGTEAWLDHCKDKNVAFTIASASIIENIKFFFEFFQLKRWFSINQIIYDDGCYENKILMFEDALTKLGTCKEETLIFEDSDSGYRCAIEAGFTKIIMIADHEDRRKLIATWPHVLLAVSSFEEVLAADLLT